MAGTLRKIRFDYFSAEIKSIEKIPRVLITWRLKRTTQNLRNLKFFVFRGGTAEDLQQLNGEGVPANQLDEYMDYTASLRDLRKVYYYKIVATEFSSDGETALQHFESDTFTWTGELDYVGLYVVEEHLFLYRYTSAGTPAYIYNKMREGTRCPDCWDNVLKRVTKSDCTTCHGTGWTGGYYQPIEAWMGFHPSPKISSIADWGERQINQTDVEFTDYPLLNIGDVILEIKNHKFWKIDNVRHTEKGRVVMTQVARLSAINRTDIEYQLEVPEGRQSELIAIMDEKRKEPEF